MNAEEGFLWQGLCYDDLVERQKTARRQEICSGDKSDY